ncbi:AbiH family protein [uncultured Streptococcus sp.]|uniref:AbiH family protein n=2 Tax=uncultured Streptococcus sp. TaxID=83427 RepID=UPI0025F597D3|nr:AbiH family protein [uncultured Streptococcus sp.]
MTHTKASQLIVLGNGFDLHCGLKSSYKDFLYYVITQRYTNYFSSDSEEASDRNEAIEKAFADSANYVGVRRIHFDAIYFERNVKMNDTIFPDINIWYLILFHEKLVQSLNQSSNWSDIESVIENYVSGKFIFNNDNGKQSQKTFIDILVDTFFSYGFERNILSKEIMEQVEYKLAGLLLYHLLNREDDCYEIKEKIEEIRKKHDNSISWRFDETRIKKIELRIKEEERPEVVNILINLLMGELHKLEIDFQTYLIQEIKREEYKSKAENFLQTIVMDGDFLSNYSVFSFNYTNLCSGNLGIQVAFRNVHGALNQNSNESKIIFGIDNISSDSRAEDIGYRFTKAYRTMRLYTELENDMAFGDKIDNIFTKDMDVIKFYGHSLARADYSYFQYIFDMYDLYNSNIKLIFYYSKIEGRTVEEVRQEQYRNITKLIEQYGETLDNKAHGRNLLTRLIQTGRLKIVGLEDDNNKMQEE